MTITEALMELSLAVRESHAGPDNDLTLEMPRAALEDFSRTIAPIERIQIGPVGSDSESGLLTTVYTQTGKVTLVAKDPQ